MLYDATELSILVFVSSILLCIPLAIIILVQIRLEGRALKDRDRANSERRIARLYAVFESIYFSYALLVVAVAVAVGWSLSDSSYARKYILPVAFSLTIWVGNGRRKKSFEATDVLAKVLSTFAEYSRKTGISGVQLAKENGTKNWPPFALFLRSFHLEQGAFNPLVIGLSENPHEKEFIRLIEAELGLFVLGLGKQEVLDPS